MDDSCLRFLEEEEGRRKKMEEKVRPKGKESAEFDINVDRND